MFENFSKKVVGMGNSIKRTTQTFSETVSLNAKIDEYKKELANCFSQLGQNYYERNKTSVPAEYQGVFDRITQLNQMIIQCQEQIKVIKGVRQCPNCGADVAGNVMFCGNCGYSMPPVNTAGPANGPVCAKCGAPLEPGAMFCTTCGARVQAAAPQQDSYGQSASSYSQPVQPEPSYGQPVQPEPSYGQPVQPEPSYEQPTVQESDYEQAVVSEEPAFGESAYEQPTEQPEQAGRVCPQCGASLAADAAFCNNCGASVLEAAAQAQESYSYGQPVEQEPVFDEPVHEAQNEAASAEAVRYCPNCGTRLEDDALFCAECGTKVG